MEGKLYSISSFYHLKEHYHISPFLLSDSILLGSGWNLNFWLLLSSQVRILRTEYAQLISLPQFTLDKANLGFFPTNRSNKIPTIMWTNSGKPTFIRVLSPCLIYLKWAHILQTEDWKKLQLKVVFFSLFLSFYIWKSISFKISFMEYKIMKIIFSLRENYQ